MLPLGPFQECYRLILQTESSPGPGKPYFDAGTVSNVYTLQGPSSDRNTQGRFV